MKSEIHRRKVNTQDDLLARKLDAAARIKKREDQLRRITLDIHTRVAKCIEVDGGIFENLQGAVTDVPLRVTDAPLRVTDVPLCVTDVPIYVTDVPLRVTDVPLRVTDVPLCVT
jgi:hypothetical protein